jgi:uncharacterized protein YxeA
MELIILAFVLFIVGVAGTMVYDKHKDSFNSKLQELKTPKAKPVKTTQPASNSNLETILQEVKTRQRNGQSTVRIQQGKNIQTMDVQELIKQIEAMKKRL